MSHQVLVYRFNATKDQVRIDMKKTRSHLAVIATVASLSFLAACSDSDDTVVTKEPAPAAEVQPASPVVTEPTTMEKIEAEVKEDAAKTSDAVKDKTEELKEATQDKSHDLKEDAAKAGDAIKDKATELKDAAGRTASDIGDAIKDGAAKADQAIQDKLGNGVQPTPPAQPSQEAKP